MSDTPRTEAEINRQKCWSEDLITIDADFCRQLERELNAANAKVQSFYEHILKHKEENALLTAKIEEHRRTIKELEDTGDYLCAAAAFMGWHDKIEEWNKAKKSK